ncbi:adenosylhomocysteinase [Candidatus Woesearchaeota archaeon]|nr:adenosylhomocysteinase [Candidatus Woesearchaeota archaeon]
MNTTENYHVKDLSLVEQGKSNIQLAEERMGALIGIRDRFTLEKPFRDLRIGMALHVTKETAVLAQTLTAGGAEVAITSCNPLSTQDDVAAALAKEKVRVWAYKGETAIDYRTFIANVADTKPHIVIDDGCDLIDHLHTKRQELLVDVIGGCEETTTGVNRLRAMQGEGVLRIPVIAVNDNNTKHLLDNYYGTGQSTLDGILRATNILLAGKTVVVAGYGSCGKGVAMRADGMGAQVIVTEMDAFRALQATYDGYKILPMHEAASIGDVFITVTGNRHVVRLDHMRRMKNGVVLANSGHFDVEIDVEGLRREASQHYQVRPQLDAYVLDGRKIYLCGEGRLVNLAVAEGHPSEVMATSFCGQALAVEYLVKNRGKLVPGVHVLPKEIDDLIARLQLHAMGVTIDAPTSEQQKYKTEWREGT